MSSSIDICNFALQRLGQTTISALDDTGLLAKQCNLIYQPTVYELLSSYEWSFAITRAQLGWVASPGSYYNPYNYVYNVPVDSLKLLSILDGTFEDSASDWLIENDFLYTDEINPLYVKYIDKTTLEVNFPEVFVTALYLRMAMKMCVKITQDQGLLQTISQEYGIAYVTATSILGTNYQNNKQPSDWWTA